MKVIGNKLIKRSKPYNFFKSDKRSMPSYMFKDNDKDGVPNVFDCKPNNPREQGFIEGLVGAGRALFTRGESVKQAWREGLEQPNVFQRKKIRRIAKVTEERFPATPEGNEAYLRWKARQARLKEQKRTIKEKAKRVTRAGYGLPIPESTPESIKALLTGRTKKEVYERVPTKFVTDEKGERKAVAWKTKKVTKYVPVGRIEALRKYQMAEREKIRTGKFSLPEKQRVIEAKRGLRLAFPIIPQQATQATYRMTGRAPSGSRGRGRPKGTVKYYIPGKGPVGVFTYRKWKSAQRQAFREQLRQQEEMLKQQQMMQQAQMQVPQEMPIQEEIPEEMAQMPEQQMIPIQQMPTEAQKRPVAYVFKSYGGKPYQAVERRPTGQGINVPPGYVEYTDAFTGQRKLKKLPRPERWSTGG